MLYKILSLFIYGAIWMLFSGANLTLSSLFIALAVAFVVQYITNRLIFSTVVGCIRPVAALRYFYWLLKEVFCSACAVSKLAWQRRIAISPSVETLDAGQNTELGQVIYANSITLTPGTATIAESDGKFLVHSLDLSFAEGLHTGVMRDKVNKIIKSEICY